MKQNQAEPFFLNAPNLQVLAARSLKVQLEGAYPESEVRATTATSKTGDRPCEAVTVDGRVFLVNVVEVAPAQVFEAAGELSQTVERIAKKRRAAIYK